MPTAPATGTTQERLAAYYQAEADALRAQSTTRGDRSRQLALLAEIRKGIAELETKLGIERRAAAGVSGLDYRLASFNPAFTR